MILALSTGGVLCLVLVVLVLFLPALVLLLLVVGYGIVVAGNIWFLVVAFQDDVIQGLLCLLIPCYSLFYLITHFEEEKTPFFVSLIGTGIVLAGVILGSPGIR